MTQRLVWMTVLLAAGACSTRSLGDSEIASLSIVEAVADEAISYGRGASPSSTGTRFLVGVLVDNQEVSANAKVALVRGKVRSASGAVLASSLPLDDDQSPVSMVPAGAVRQLGFGASIDSIKHCPLQCSAPTQQMRADEFVLDVVFSVDEKEIALSAKSDLYCSCLESL